MDLFQVLLNIHDFKDDETIYAVEPWTLESEAQVILEPGEGVININSGHFIFEYFFAIRKENSLHCSKLTGIQKTNHSLLL